MTHHKRRHRRRAGIKGHCGLCMLRKTDGRRNGRLLTLQERAHEVSVVEQRTEPSDLRLLTSEEGEHDAHEGWLAIQNATEVGT